MSQLYFPFRRKGETRDRARTIIVDLSLAMYPSAHSVAANVVARACAILGCDKTELAILEPDATIQILSARQERVAFAGPEYCSLQGEIDRLSQQREAW